jgi:hypothetical protein
VGLEQYELSHGLGSSGGESRLIRLAYYEHPDYVPLLRRAYAGWDEIEAESGSPLLTKTGGLYLGRAHEPFIAESRRAADLHGLAYEMLDRGELATRFPPSSRRPTTTSGSSSPRAVCCAPSPPSPLSPAQPAAGSRSALRRTRGRVARRRRRRRGADRARIAPRSTADPRGRPLDESRRE